MHERKATRFLCLLVCLLVLTGCDRSAKKRGKGIAEASDVKTELENVKAELEKTKIERDVLKENAAAFTNMLEDANSTLTNMIQIQEGLEQQVVELIKQRDAIVVKLQDTEAMVTTLRSQLGEKTAEIQQLTQWNAEWQAVVQDLENKIEQASKPVVAEPNEVPVEQLQEEIINEDNV